MKILLIGGGGREHAIAAAVKRSPQNPLLYTVMAKKNPGIAALSEKILIHDEKDARAIAEFAKENGIDLAFIGPEAPLSAGVSDALWAAGVPAVGPKKDCARIETDKAWARGFIEKHGIGGNPKYAVFTDYEQAAAFIDKLKDVAVKPAGLTGGKGVKVMGDQLPDIAAAKAYTKEVLKSDSVVIEERFVGEEFTLQAFVDGKNLAFCPTAQDHKRAYEGDIGPNTGGMGAYTNAGALLPFITPEEYETAENIMKNTVAAFPKETGDEFKGILYGQFILTNRGPKLIEYNARFGDPEAMNVLSLLETDIVEIMKAVTSGTLDKIKIEFSNKATVCKYAVPAGYPDEPKKDTEVIVLAENAIAGTATGPTSDLIVYYSAVYEKDGKIFTTGSRSIGVVGLAETLEEAEKISRDALDNKIKGELFFRKDIGTSALVRKRIEHMDKLRAEKVTKK
ncbi:MAG: phosphoribosylamine--glycine ligase [Methanosarcinales archaeon]|jgi:phosphoribosylamine--glycine ligase|nr:phosphoribosylamine--glycine ligase [Methanosarcinales archaeon]